jgi:hypothetical protein
MNTLFYCRRVFVYGKGKEQICVVVVEEEFQHDRDTPSMPGWKLNETWMKDEGVPPEGILSLTYFSGDGKKVDECEANVVFRKALTNLVSLFLYSLYCFCELWVKDVALLLTGIAE